LILKVKGGYNSPFTFFDFGNKKIFILSTLSKKETFNHFHLDLFNPNPAIGRIISLNAPSGA